MKPTDIPPSDIRDTLWRIVDMGKMSGGPREWAGLVIAYLSKDQLRHVFAADRLVDDHVAFRVQAGRNFMPMDHVRKTLKRVYEHGKLPGIEVDVEVDGALTKQVVVEVHMSSEEIQHFVLAGRIVDEKVILIEGDRILGEAKAKGRDAKAKAAADARAKK